MIAREPGTHPSGEAPVPVSAAEPAAAGGWGETPSLGEGLDDDWPISAVTF